MQHVQLIWDYDKSVCKLFFENRPVELQSRQRLLLLLLFVSPLRLRVVAGQLSLVYSVESFYDDQMCFDIKHRKCRPIYFFIIKSSFVHIVLKILRISSVVKFEFCKCNVCPCPEEESLEKLTFNVQASYITFTFSALLYFIIFFVDSIRM